MTPTLWASAFVILLLNLPFGYWRAGVARFSRGWFLAVHVPVPFVILIANRYGHRSRPAIQEVQQRIAELTADAEENVSGVHLVMSPGE